MATTVIFAGGFPRTGTTLLLELLRTDRRVQSSSQYSYEGHYLSWLDQSRQYLTEKRRQVSDAHGWFFEDLTTLVEQYAVNTVLNCRIYAEKWFIHSGNPPYGLLPRDTVPYTVVVQRKFVDHFRSACNWPDLQNFGIVETVQQYRRSVEAWLNGVKLVNVLLLQYDDLVAGRLGSLSPLGLNLDHSLAVERSQQYRDRHQSAKTRQLTDNEIRYLEDFEREFSWDVWLKRFD